MPGLWELSIDQQHMIDRMQTQSLPVVVADMTHYENISRGIVQVDDYLHTRYRIVKEDRFGAPSTPTASGYTGTRSPQAHTSTWGSRAFARWYAETAPRECHARGSQVPVAVGSLSGVCMVVPTFL